MQIRIGIFPGLPVACLLCLVLAFPLSSLAGPKAVRGKIIMKPSPRQVSTAADENEDLSEIADKGPIEDSALDLALPYTYQSAGKIDPFAPLVHNDGSGAPGPIWASKCPPTPEAGPLTRFDLGQLQLKGLVHSVSGSFAVIQTPAGKAFMVREGNAVGRRSGRLQRILPGGVEVAECVSGPGGGPFWETKHLSLPSQNL